MPFNVPREVGDIYDVGIETIDASTLACKDRSGTVRNIAKVGYMTAPTQLQEEATELQEKAKLVQLQQNFTDREFDQWLQLTQGDWSGGMYQRILTEQNRYWDGLGVLWRTDDFLPQQPLAPAMQTGTAPVTAVLGGTAAGYLAGGGNGYAYFYSANGTTTLVFVSGSPPGNTVYTLANPVPAAQTIIDFTIGGGAIWFTALNGTGGVAVYWCYLVAGVLTVTKLADISTTTTTSRTGMAVAMVGNQVYVAAVARYSRTGGQFQDTVRLFNVTGTTTYTTNSFLDLILPDGMSFTQAVFLGDQLFISLTDGANSFILSYSISTQQWSTQARLDGIGQATMVAIAGGLFILGRTSISATLNAIDLYLLQGGALQYIAPLDSFDGTYQYAFATALSRPAAFGPYACFTVVTTNVNQVNLIVFSYDVLRGRLFKMASLNNVGTVWPANYDNMPLAVFSAVQRALPATFNADWGVAINVAGVAASPNTVQELLVGVNPSAQLPILQQPTSIISSLVDFTSAQNKLFRQIVAQFSPLPNNANVSVTLNAWLDQDPNALAAVPDFTATVTGGAVNVGVKQLVLPINKVGRKIVYQIVTTGGGYYAGAWVAAVKPLAVMIRAATGWAWHLFLALSRNTLTNSQSPEDYAYDREGMDEVVAYNFLKQLWRIWGGQCKLTMPNGDTYNAMIQSVRFKSPKPFAASFTGNVPDDRYENVAEILVREDI